MPLIEYEWSCYFWAYLKYIVFNNQNLILAETKRLVLPICHQVQINTCQFWGESIFTNAIATAFSWWKNGGGWCFRYVLWKTLPWTFSQSMLYLLHELLMRRALSIELEEHLVNQVLKVEDGRFSYTDDALVLVARILIIRTSTGSSLGDDSLRLKICKGFSSSKHTKTYQWYICGNSSSTRASLTILQKGEACRQQYFLTVYAME